MRIVVICVAFACFGQRAGAAEPQQLDVMVFGGQERAGFISALRIQVASDANVITAPMPSGVTLGERFDAATRDVEQRGAALGVWFEQADSGSFVLYAVGVRRGRGLVEVGQTGTGAAGDRELALKVSALVDELVHEPVTRAIGARVVTPGSDVTKTTAPSKPDGRWSGVLSVGGTGLTSRGAPRVQGGGFVGLGAQLDVWSGHLELSGSGYWMRDRSLANQEGEATLSEVGATLAAAARIELGRFAVGPRLSLALRRLETSAVTNDALSGQTTSDIPAIDGAFSIRARLAPHLALSFAVGGGVNLVAEEVTTRGQTIMEVNRVRALLELGLVGVWPN